jgi:hypothetical protein
MNFEKINNLLIKYFNGDTSLEEERKLMVYFSSDNVDERLIKYKPFFISLRKEKEVEPSDVLLEMISQLILPRRIVDKRPFMEIIKGKTWWRMAATVAILLVASWAISKHFESKSPSIIGQIQPRKAKIIVLDENTDPQMALIEVEKALMRVSKNMKKGTDETTESLQKVRTATKVFRN